MSAGKRRRICFILSLLPQSRNHASACLFHTDGMNSVDVSPGLSVIPFTSGTSQQPIFGRRTWDGVKGCHKLSSEHVTFFNLAGNVLDPPLLIGWFCSFFQPHVFVPLSEAKKTEARGSKSLILAHDGRNARHPMRWNRCMWSAPPPVHCKTLLPPQGFVLRLPYLILFFYSCV